MQYQVSPLGKKRRSRAAELDRYLEELLQTDAGDYARYLASEGALAPEGERAVSSATLDAARSRADYGAQAETLREAGLLHSGYADYLQNAALARHRAARDTAARAGMQTEAPPAEADTSKDTLRRTVLSALRSAGFTKVEDAALK